MNTTSTYEKNSGAAWPTFRLGYVSRAAGPIGDVELNDIAEISKWNNECEGVTGVLLRCGDRFAQVLEGEEGAVMTAFRRISDDPRHEDVKVVATEITEARRFAEAEMLYVSIRHDDMPDDFLLSNQNRDIRVMVDAFDQIERLVEATAGARSGDIVASQALKSEVGVGASYAAKHAISA